MENIRVFFTVCLFGHIFQICIQTRTNQSSKMHSNVSSAGTGCSDLQRNCIFLCLHWFFPKDLTTLISLEGLFFLPMLFPLTGIPPQIIFQGPQQSLEIPLQYLAVEVSSFSSPMKCLWNSGVCLSGVCLKWRCIRLGWGGDGMRAESQ